MSRKDQLKIIFTIAIWSAINVGFSSCQIEGMLEEPAGSIFVAAFDTTGTEITGGEIFLDGVTSNQVTPDTLENVPVGDHTVRVEATGYESAETEVTVNENELTEVSLTLSLADVGLLEVSSEPAGALIIIDQQSTGQFTPFSFTSVAVGPREVSVFMDGYKTLSPALQTPVVTDPQTEVSVSFQLQAGYPGHQEGDIAYDFTLEDDFGNQVSLHNYRGRVVILSYFFKDCPNCIAEFPEIEQIYQDYLPYGVQVLGIDPMFFDDLEDVQFVRNELGLSFKLLLDWGSLTTTDYGVIAYPTNFVIAQGGDIAARLLSVNYEILADILNDLLGL